MQLLVGLVTVLAFSMNLFAQAPFTVFEKSINEIQEALEKGDVTSVELVDQYPVSYTHLTLPTKLEV